MSLTDNLNQARRAASQDPARLMSFRFIRDEVMRLLGEHTPTEESLRKLHSERECPAHPDPVVVWALAQVYEVPLADLSPEADTLIRSIAAMLSQDEMVAAGRLVASGVASTGEPTFRLVPASHRAPRNRCCVPYAQPALPGFDGQVWIGAAPVRSDGAEHPVQRLVAA